MLSLTSFKSLGFAGPRSNKRNTINICIGHKHFPGSKLGYIDVMLSPVSIEVDGPFKLFVVEDELWGPHGHSLSEYSQLFWLSDNFDKIIGEHEFIRLLQYRKFISPAEVGNQSIWHHARWLPPEQIGNFDELFERQSVHEFVSRPLGLGSIGSSMARQFALCHKMEDLLLFATFLIREKILPESLVTEFMLQPDLVPVGSMGVIRREPLRFMLNTLKAAAKFKDTPQFIPRHGAQRRSTGFLLERLHSFLIYQHMANTNSIIATGLIVVLSNTPELEAAP